MILIQADAASIPLANDSVHCVITSPPYWGLRAYSGEQARVWGGLPDCQHEWESTERKLQTGGANPKQQSNRGVTGVGWIAHSSYCGKCGAWYGALGLEPNIDQHITNMVEVMREVYRVLRPDGVVWFNYADCYLGTGGENGNAGLGSGDRSGLYRNNPRSRELAQGNLALMPQRLAIAFQADGWFVRKDVIWYKPNPMPESQRGWRWERHRIKIAKSKHAADNDIRGGHKKMLEDASVHQGINPDWLPTYENCPGCEKCQHNDPNKPDGYILRKASWRHTTAHEYIFMLTKGMGYWADQEAIRVPHAAASIERAKNPNFGVARDAPGAAQMNKMLQEQGIHLSSGGRNPRSVIEQTTTGYKGAHYATFPPDLIAPLMRATCPRRICPECHEPWAVVVDYQATHKSQVDYSERWPNTQNKTSNPIQNQGTEVSSSVRGYAPTCDCGRSDHIPGIVLDPFGGSGTTGMVAKQLLRRFVHLDISLPYIQEQATIRTGAAQPPGQLDDLPLFSNGG